MSLARFAWRIAGPIDAALNLAINGGIAWFFLHRATDVPLFGWFSAYIFLAPMVVCVLTFATWFGVRNAMIQTGKLHTNWSGRAWRAGLTYAVCGCAVLTMACLMIHRLWPDMRIPAAWLIMIDALGSAVLGYSTQVHGVLRAPRVLSIAEA
jgi:hypothetical protein